MHRVLTTLRRGFKERIGWKRLGIALSLLIIAFAVWTLLHTLRGVDTGVILTALTEIPRGRIGLAALCVVCAFCTLTFYDFFALRTIGKKQVMNALRKSLLLNQMPTGQPTRTKHRQPREKAGRWYSSASMAAS